LLQCRSAERALPLAAVGAVVLHGLLELPLEYAFFLFPVGLLMGALDAQEPQAPALTTYRAVFAVPLLLLAALASWVGTEYLKVDETGRVLRFVVMGIGLDKVPTAPEPDVVLLDRPRNLHRFLLTPAHTDNDRAYLQWVRDVAARYPTTSALLRHALAAGLNGQPAEAELVLARMCKLHSASSCDQARAYWAELQTQVPQLKSIRYPEQSRAADVQRAP